MLKNRQLQLLAGKVAATVTLPKASDRRVEAWAKQNEGGQSAILFGSSDMLLMSPDVYEFDRATDEQNVGRTINNYHAAILRNLHWDGKPRMFRALSFLRAQRPEYERLTLEQLEQLIGQFEAICATYGTACQVLLGYGWADLYLYFASEELDPLFAAVVACRAVPLDANHPVGVFRNAFTIVGVDFDRRVEAAASTQLVRPKISLRVEPSELRSLIEDKLPLDFPDEQWKIAVTSGKRDVFIIPHRSVPFKDFWSAHHKWRVQIGEPDSPLYKMETHFDFERKVLPTQRWTQASIRCKCESSTKTLDKAFVDAVTLCTSMGPGLARSYHGLARLYQEALGDDDSCCDFDAAAAHYFRQRRVFDEYERLCNNAKSLPGDESAYALQIRRRRDLLRDALDRLEISSVFIFHQEQNGSYADLLSRSERVSLYRGGMQKINSVLLMTIDFLIERYGLPMRPMLCWWPAGQIQSERPNSVIKVPVYYLHQPEVALFLIIHELGQLAAYEFYRKLPVPMKAKSRLRNLFSDEDLTVLQSLGIRQAQPKTLPRGNSATLDEFGASEPPSQAPGMQWFLSWAERLGIDTGKMITDMWADVFLFRIGFNHDMTGLLNFLLGQFLRLLIREQEVRSSIVRTVQLGARLISILAVGERLDREGDPDVAEPISENEVAEAARLAIQYLSVALRDPMFADDVSEEETHLSSLMAGAHVAVEEMFLDENVLNVAMDLALGYSDYLADVLTYTNTFVLEPDTVPEGLNDVKEGFLAEIDRARLPSYFRSFLTLGDVGSASKKDEQLTSDEREQRRQLFLARSALVSSILASCKRIPRLPIELAELEKERKKRQP